MQKQTYPDVPTDEVGDMVQNQIDAGAKKVTVALNDDGTTCTVVIVK